MNKPAIPRQSLLQDCPYVPANKTDLRARFESMGLGRLRTAEYHMRDSDGQDGNAQTEERRDE